MGVIGCDTPGGGVVFPALQLPGYQVDAVRIHRRDQIKGGIVHQLRGGDGEDASAGSKGGSQLFHKFQQQRYADPFVGMKAGVIEHPVFPAAQIHPPERPAHHAAADLPGADEGIAGGQAPDAVAHQGGAVSNIGGHHREGKGDHQLLPQRQRLRPDAGICQQDGLHAAAVALGKGIDAVPPAHLMGDVTQIPGQDGPVGLVPGHAVRRETPAGLKAPEGRLRPRAKVAVGIQGTVPGPVQGQLQKLYRRACAADLQ